VKAKELNLEYCQGLLVACCKEGVSFVFESICFGFLVVCHGLGSELIIPRVKRAVKDTNEIGSEGVVLGSWNLEMTL
jgi:hypothetical protein